MQLLCDTISRPYLSDLAITRMLSVLGVSQLLAEDFPQARIITFGYDADVVKFWTIASSNCLSDHGKSLAQALLDQRAVLEAKPIIFIAHSLGELVCEEALVLSDKREYLQSILANTSFSWALPTVVHTWHAGAIGWRSMSMSSGVRTETL
jgi:hypothetical protein